MTDSFDHKNFNAADIERYHAGKMPAAEMHAIEKAAMEDPFLADALEGYAFATTPLVDIEKIKNRLAQKNENEKVVPLFKKYQWLKAAAVIIFIAGGSWLAISVLSTNKSGLAKNETLNRDTNSENQNNIIVASPKLDSANITAKDELQNDIKEQEGTNARTNSVNSFPTNGTIELQKDKTLEDQTKQGDVATTNVNVAFDNTKVYKPSAEEKKRAVVSGPVSNNNMNRNSDVSYNRSVTEANNNTRAKEEADKLFFKSRNDSLADKDVAVLQGKYRGATNTDTIKNLNIVMQPSSDNLSEVVVMSSGDKKKAERKMPNVKIDTLEPAGGWAGFDEYIATNIKMPEELQTKQPYSGEVELSFEINKNGEAVNIAVVKSLCKKCDEEAIRLLKEGPKWKKKKNKNAKITIKF